MNIFLPYENDLGESIKALDDVRLNKQILECYQLLRNAIKEKIGELPNGWCNHPVYLFYKDNPSFLCAYARKCCLEYEFRFGKEHKLREQFRLIHIIYNLQYDPIFIPYYMEGSKGQPNYIRTTDNVSALFQQKLIKKWNVDKEKGRPPKWSNREVPKFYQEWLKENGDE